MTTELTNDERLRAESATEAGSGEAALICECGHAPNIHTPCCVSACGCDEFTPRKLSIEELFKAAMREIKELAQDALGYDQICDPIQAVRRLAQEFSALKAQLVEAHNEREGARKLLLESSREIIRVDAQLAEAQVKLNTEIAEHTREVLLHAVTKARAEKAEADAARLKEENQKLCGQIDDAVGEIAIINGKAEKLRAALEHIKRAAFLVSEAAINSGADSAICRLLNDMEIQAQAALSPAAPAEEVKE